MSRIQDIGLLLIVVFLVVERHPWTSGWFANLKRIACKEPPQET